MSGEGTQKSGPTVATNYYQKAFAPSDKRLLISIKSKKFIHEEIYTIAAAQASPNSSLNCQSSSREPNGWLALVISLYFLPILKVIIFSPQNSCRCLIDFLADYFYFNIA